MGFPSGSAVKNLPANTGDGGSIYGLSSTPEGGNGNPLQCSYLENSMNRGVWWPTVHGVAKSQTPLGTQAYASVSREGIGYRGMGGLGSTRVTLW